MEPSFRALFAPFARRRPGRATEPCFRAYRVRARPRAFRGGAPDCACARMRGRGAARTAPRRFASRPAGQGGPAPCVMECHVLSWPPCGEPIATRHFGNGSADPLGFAGIASPAWIPLPSLVRAMRPPPARPCCGTLFSRVSRARSRAFRGGAPDCACARARGRGAARTAPRRFASRPAGQGGPAPCVMECHVLSWPPCGEPIATRQFGNNGR